MKTALCFMHAIILAARATGDSMRGAVPALKCGQRSALAIALLFLISGSCEAASQALAPVATQQSLLQQRRANPRLAFSGDFLVSICTSPDREDSEYCDGYLDVSLGWRFSAACDSVLPADRQYCAGVKAANDKSKSLLTDEECVKCDTVKKTCVTCDLKEYVAKLRAKMGTCSRLEHDENYCAGYNEAAESQVFGSVSLFADNMGLGARELGGADRSNAFGLSLVGGLAAINRWQPCIPKQPLGVKEIRSAFLDFVRENPEQRKNQYAILVFLWALYYKVCPTVSSDLHPNAEVCTDWTWHDHQYGTQNVCDRTVVVQFTTSENPSVATRELSPGESILFERNILSLSTTCLAGFVPSVPFASQNSDIIGIGQYHCVKK